ncbi:hypothetical protein B0T19DRAFT_352011 [Cercophora scortea]|uniref:Uncharacterized protein n=1 Tax=Cercophora scortea TaxID=314031 RepID=A0AAE0J235_9PEZI|nr:hypothetical protein B0T19DRAFT_352011 [Cercophora scortea]
MTKAHRALNASSSPTPVTSSQSTPLSSAYPSTYASEVEGDPDDDVNQIAISALTLGDSPDDSQALVVKKKPAAKKTPFRFLDLPSELRIKVYEFYFAEAPSVVDLEPDNYKRIHKDLRLLRSCRTIYYEASHTFYSSRTFRLFPCHAGRFSKTKKPLLARLNTRQRSWITSLELRLGPGWNKPPRSWIVNPSLGLADCKNVQTLSVFVECDPSDGVFNGFRRADGFYEGFSRNLLNDVLADMPFVSSVQFDAWTSVKKSGGMMRSLLEAAVNQGRSVRWGPERGWTDMDVKEKIVDSAHTTTSTHYGQAGISTVVVA